jgi:hypothetical protein
VGGGGRGGGERRHSIASMPRTCISPGGGGGGGVKEVHIYTYIYVYIYVYIYMYIYICICKYTHVYRFLDMKEDTWQACFENMTSLSFDPGQRVFAAGVCVLVLCIV